MLLDKGRKGTVMKTGIIQHIKKLNSKMRYYYYKSMNEKDYPRALSKIFYKHFHYPLNLSNPITFNEKMQWLKLFDSTPLKTRLADKYLVREWIAEKIGEEYLISLLGVWNSFEEINFEELPQRFVLKTNHGSGYVILVNDKNEINYKEMKKKVDQWMKENFAFKLGFELQYKDILPKIVVEEFINSESEGLSDFKIHCFNGKPEFIQIIGERDLEKHSAKEVFFDTKWNVLDCTYTYPNPDKESIKKIKEPIQLNQMLVIAEKLADGFKYVRVDLYLLENGTIKFGEMTFTAASGFDHWNPQEYDKKWGELIKI